MNIRGLIPRNFADLAEAVPIAGHCVTYCSLGHEKAMICDKGSF